MRPANNDLATSMSSNGFASHGAQHLGRFNLASPRERRVGSDSLFGAKTSVGFEQEMFGQEYLDH